MLMESFTRQTRADDQTTHAALMQGLPSIADVKIVDNGNPIQIERKRNVLKNRWGMKATVEVQSGVVTVTVEGAGSMH